MDVLVMVTVEEKRNFQLIGGVLDLIAESEDHESRPPAQIAETQRTNDDLGPNAAGVAHGDSNCRTGILHLIILSYLIEKVRSGKPIRKSGQGWSRQHAKHYHQQKLLK